MNSGCGLKIDKNSKILNRKIDDILRKNRRRKKKKFGNKNTKTEGVLQDPMEKEPKAGNMYLKIKNSNFYDEESNFWHTSVDSSTHPNPVFDYTDPESVLLDIFINYSVFGFESTEEKYYQLKSELYFSQNTPNISFLSIMVQSLFESEAACENLEKTKKSDHFDDYNRLWKFSSNVGILKNLGSISYSETQLLWALAEFMTGNQKYAKQIWRELPKKDFITGNGWWSYIQGEYYPPTSRDQLLGIILSKLVGAEELAGRKYNRLIRGSGLYESEHGFLKEKDYFDSNYCCQDQLFLVIANALVIDKIQLNIPKSI